jgi:hypothetical protein
MLGEACAEFQNKVDKLDPGDKDYPAHLRAAILKLTRDAAAHFADYDNGEVPAILERSRFVLSWLQSEAEDAEDRQRRYNREQAVLSLLFLCSAVTQGREPDRASWPGRRRAAGVNSRGVEA